MALRDIFILGAQTAGIGKDGDRIIALHEISDRSAFKHRLAWLQEHYRLVSMDELFKPQKSGGKPRIVLTFDDGYASWHENAAPILEELKIPAVFFVCSGFIGLSENAAAQFLYNHIGRRQRHHLLQPLTHSQLADLAAHDLFEIGSHTVHHIDLGKKRSKSVLDEEINGDIQFLENHTGHKVRWFAFPYGMKRHISLQSLNFIKTNTSLEGAFTYIPGFNTEKTDPFYINRDGFCLTEPVRVWKARLKGCYDSIYRIKTSIRDRFRKKLNRESVTLDAI